MFYSQCLLSRKGPLKAIWVAAYSQNKLKKNQVSETDISTSIDEIISYEVSVTYRVLGYLLLGVVRIYSKQVEYFYEDCNDFLSRMNSYAPLRKHSSLKEAMCAPYHSITLPDKFELDAFNLDISNDLSAESMDNHHQITLKEMQEDAGYDYNSLSKHNQMEQNLCFEIGSEFYSPVHGILSPQQMEIDMVVSLSHNPTMLEASMEKFQDDQFPQEGPDLEMNCGMTPTITEATMERFQDDQFPQESSKLEMNCGMTSAVTEASVERFQDDQLPQEEGRDLEMNFGTEEPPDLGAKIDDHLPQEEGRDLEMNFGTKEPLDLGVKTDEVNQRKRIKFLEITPPDHLNSDIFSEAHPVASTANGSPDDLKFPQNSGGMTPEILVVRTPAKMEKARFSRKRKYLFDDKIVLSNELVRKSLHDSTSLVAKRRKVPITALDVWRVCKYSDPHWDFSEPLITCSSQLRDFFFGKNFLTLELVEDAAGHTKFTEDRLETPRKSSEEEAFLEKQIGDHPLSVMFETCFISSEQEALLPKNVSDHSPSARSIASPTSSKSDRRNTPVANGGDGMTAFETPENGLNLLDEELCSQEEDNRKQDGFSIRTRKVASYLCESFQKQKDKQEKNSLSLEQALEGKTKKESARVFYEILVLKCRELVDVKQDAPYADIVVLGTPELKETFSN